MSKQLDMNQPVQMDELLDMDESLDMDDLFDRDDLLNIDEPLEGDEEYYFDRHPTEEELMSEASVHARLIRYLIAVLEQLFEGEICVIHQNLNFYQTPALYEHPTAPDIALIKGASWEELRSWKVGPTWPPPQVVIEIASEETWKNDRKKKPALYGGMGVLEYFLYDPNTPPCWKRPKSRLLGWRWDTVSQKMRRLVPNKRGRIWSEQLDSWLMPDGSYLRLYDRHNQLRLTGEEAQALRAEAEAHKVAILAEKLRSLGISPDELF